MIGFDVVKKFDEVCEAHPIVKKFGYGRRDSKGSLFDDFGKEFPLVWIATDSFRTKENTIVYGVNVDVFSILKDSEVNADKTISDMTAIIVDLRNDFIDDLESVEIQLTPYHWELETGELIAGVQAVFNFETSINNCKF